MQSNSVSAFVFWLARLRALFRDVHIAVQRSPCFVNVSTDVIPSAESPSDVRLSLSLMAELANPPDSAKRALGMTIELSSRDNEWSVDAEVGWSGADIGWDVIDSRNTISASLDCVMTDTIPLVEWLSSRFGREAAAIDTKPSR